MRKTKFASICGAALACAALLAFPVGAQDAEAKPPAAVSPKPQSLWIFSRIRTLPGKQREYLEFLSTTWKAQREALKRHGALLSYHVFIVKAQRENEPDIILASEFPDRTTFAERERLQKLVRAELAKAPPGTYRPVDLDTLRMPVEEMEVEDIRLP